MWFDEISNFINSIDVKEVRVLKNIKSMIENNERDIEAYLKEFECPVSFCLIETPMTVNDEITYEENSIFELRDCPVTRKPILTSYYNQDVEMIISILKKGNPFDVNKFLSMKLRERIEYMNRTNISDEMYETIMEIMEPVLSVEFENEDDEVYMLSEINDTIMFSYFEN